MNTGFSPPYQVFLNYPFDEAAEPISAALHFGVISAGLLPVCAFDLTTPDRPRLEALVDAISQCKFSAHDFSKNKGEGDQNLARFNMPIEMGMAVFHAIQTQRREHRCAFFVTSPHLYKQFASDLAGLDPISYDDEESLVKGVYEWLRDNIHAALNSRSTAEVIDGYQEYKRRLAWVRGSGKNGRPSHHEQQELMFQSCTKFGFWNWRASAVGQDGLPEVPFAWIDGAPKFP